MNDSSNFNSCECGCGQDPGYYLSSNSHSGIVKGDPKRYVNGHNVPNKGRRTARIKDYPVLEQPKLCSTCGEIRPHTEFYKDKREKSGLNSTCKLCNKASTQRYAESNREKIRERARTHRENNRERRNESSRRYYENNKEKHAERVKRWGLNNPESSKLRVRKRQALRLGAPGDGATLTELVSIHGSACYLCKEAVATEVDHVTPLSRGGTNYPDNLRPACTRCNRSKGAKTYEEYVRP